MTQIDASTEDNLRLMKAVCYQPHTEVDKLETLATAIGKDFVPLLGDTPAESYMNAVATILFGVMDDVQKHASGDPWRTIHALLTVLHVIGRKAVDVVELERVTTRG